MTQYTLKTDRDGVRDLRELRRQLHNGEAETSEQFRSPGPDTIVELLADVAADDYTEQDAYIVKLEGNAWVRQRLVKVRKVGTGAITATSGEPFRAIASRIGNLGLCVVVSSGGNGGCSTCCTSVRTGNLLHPDLPTGYDETTRDWSFASACGDAIGAIEIPNTDGSLILVWAGGIPVASYEDTGNTFVADISTDCTILDIDGVDVTGSTTFTATITMDFTLKEIVISWEETV